MINQLNESKTRLRHHCQFCGHQSNQNVGTICSSCGLRLGARLERVTFGGAGKTLTCEIMGTRREAMRGLSKRPYLAPGLGAIFRFHKWEILLFECRQMLIPIDIIVCAGGVVTKIVNSENDGWFGYHGPWLGKDVIIETNPGELNDSNIGSTFSVEKV